MTASTTGVDVMATPRMQLPADAMRRAVGDAIDEGQTHFSAPDASAHRAPAHTWIYAAPANIVSTSPGDSRGKIARASVRVGGARKLDGEDTTLAREITNSDRSANSPCDRMGHVFGG